jgi:SAM-dependent methyltransferase
VNAPAQQWDPARYLDQASFVPALGAPVVDLLAPRPGERILDLGCGDGTLTLALARIADVVGVDSSPEQIAAARARGLDARVVDGGALGFVREFDAVFSNAALHWMRDPDAVIAGVARALKPRGRFVGEMGGAHNVEAITTEILAALDRRGIDGAAWWPWYFPDEAEYRARLERAGFEVRSIDRFSRPTPLPGRLVGWLETFAGSFLKALPAAEHAAFLDEVEARLAPRLRDPSGAWTADYVRLRFAAVLP